MAPVILTVKYHLLSRLFRMSQEEFLTWKDHPIPNHEPRYSHDEIADFHANPEKYLDF